MAPTPADLAQTLAEARADAESRMVDTCRITRPADEPGEFNESTGKYDDPDPIVVYEGKCSIPRASVTTAAANGGDAVWEVGEYPFAVPITDPTTANIAPTQTVEYVTAIDPALVGLVFGVVEPINYTAAKDRRFKIKRAVSN